METTQEMVVVLRYLTASGREYHVLAPDAVNGVERRIRGDVALAVAVGDRITEVKNMLMPLQQYRVLARDASFTSGPFPETVDAP